MAQPGTIDRVMFLARLRVSIRSVKDGRGRGTGTFIDLYSFLRLELTVQEDAAVPNRSSSDGSGLSVEDGNSWPGQTESWPLPPESIALSVATDKMHICAVWSISGTGVDVSSFLRISNSGGVWIGDLARGPLNSFHSGSSGVILVL